ncbi:MAG TPA: SDR family NAD(P)-dependent oxidoreductase [Solirubrobacterales bacterium]|jgi:NAD(P)-dependent dehydrogenase (short-subunit alcohol dehydrogenase family)|nr:SDR family NAD(P)-dependent oxidoreductase [Solirubrobacterales bacterium]
MNHAIRSIGRSKPADWLLDRTVLPGFSSIGYRVRGLAGSDPDSDDRLRGRAVVITGATSGIGAAAAERCAAAGAHVHMVIRDVERGAGVRERISAATGSDDIRLHHCDMSSLRSVRELAEELNRDLGAGAAALVHNAGVLTHDRETSIDGHELTLATHVLGPLLLTELLAPALAGAAPSRVIFVSSGGMYTARLDADDLELDQREFHGPTVYAHAKRIQVILAGLLDERLEPRGITVDAMHPGWVDTPGVAEALPRFHTAFAPILRTPAEGADTIVWLAAGGEQAAPGGELWMDRRIRPAHRVPWTRETAAERDRLWSNLHEMVAEGHHLTRCM